MDGYCRAYTLLSRSSAITEKSLGIGVVYVKSKPAVAIRE